MAVFHVISGDGLFLLVFDLSPGYVINSRLLLVPNHALIPEWQHSGFLQGGV